MNKKVQNTLFSLQALGFLTWILSSIFRDKLSDFTLGFCEGFSFILIFVGYIYVLWNSKSNKNIDKVTDK